ncbi:MAG: hypothetical protein U0836_03360 [Pirellulales bacterium]
MGRSRMTSEQIRGLHQAKPFEPFTLNLADGRAIDVPHPELLLQTQGGRTIFVNTHDEIVEIIDLLLVTSVSRGAAPTGRKRRRG